MGAGQGLPSHVLLQRLQKNADIMVTIDATDSMMPQKFPD